MLERARALCWLARYAEAARAARRSLRASRTGLERSLSLAVLSQAACGAGDYGEGLRSAADAVREAPEGALHTPKLAEAGAYAALGRYGEARLSAHAALTGAKSLRSRDRADALHALGDVEHRDGQFGQAVALWQLALSIRRAELREGHPETGFTADALAHTLRRMGQPGLAVGLHREALSIYGHSFDPGHPAISSCRHGLAQALHRTGRSTEALAELQIAAESAAERLGEDHPDTWVSRFELGRIEFSCGDVQQGMLRMEASRARAAELLGEGHPTVAAMDRWRKGGLGG